jgi:hypothetical protein
MAFQQQVMAFFLKPHDFLEEVMIFSSVVFL